MALTAILPLTTIRCFGWGHEGHMTVAAIAFETLGRDDPAARAAVVELLEKFIPKSHLGHWADQVEGLDGSERSRALFMLAARWPDDMKSLPAFKKKTGSWHYINKPIIQPSSPNKNPQVPTPNLITEYPVQLVIASDKLKSAVQRAEALCWIFHLVGDLHQPLHTTDFYSEEFPEGDSGGNDFIIRTAEENTTLVRLHGFWDGLGAKRTATFEGAHRRSLVLAKDYPAANLSELVANSVFEKWIDESYLVGVNDTYLKGKLRGVLNTGRGREIVVDQDVEVPALPDGYAARAKAIADRRIALAGYRLAAQLRTITK